MSEADDPAEWTQYGRLGQVRYSVSNLLDEFGHTDSLGFGAVVNTAMVLLGAGVYWGLSGWVSYVGAVWALIHVVAIVKGVIEA